MESTGCTRTRPRRSTGSEPARTSSSRRAPRRGSRSATSSRSSTRSCPANEIPPCSIFPTKALAQDQLRALRSWLVPGLRAVTYDGDTASDDRAWARKNANVVLTNPEMLHMGILPSHKRWATFLMRLRYVVVDELHTLRGIFGSQVAHVLRRLQRLCEHYDATPDVLLRDRDDRQPGRAGDGAVRAPGRGDRRRRLTPRRARARLLATAAPRRTLRRARLGQRRDRRPARPVRALGPPDARIHAEPPQRRARRPTRAHRLEDAGVGARAAASRRTAPDTSPKNDGRSNATCRAAGSSASRPPTRSSSASTSAGSTPSSSTGSRARSRRCGNRPVVPAAPDAARRRCLSPGDDQLDQWYAAHPRELPTASPSVRS